MNMNKKFRHAPYCVEFSMQHYHFNEHYRDTEKLAMIRILYIIIIKRLENTIIPLSIIFHISRSILLYLM